ncbi:hypothetical protein SNEBB_004246 [Seison nebaliae]|nr:hypothetical protein SNEBB_004246 [Seison nebaliae]
MDSNRIILVNNNNNNRQSVNQLRYSTGRSNFNQLMNEIILANEKVYANRFFNPNLFSFQFEPSGEKIGENIIRNGNSPLMQLKYNEESCNCENGCKYVPFLSTTNKSLSCKQLDIFIYNELIRQNLGCAFCRKILTEVRKNELFALDLPIHRDLLRQMLNIHNTVDRVTNNASCPYLRSLHCKICGATGDSAHTLKYCPAIRDNIPPLQLAKR